MDAPRKSVLFCMGGRNRIGSSAGTGVFVSDKSALTAAVRAQFGDILSEKQDFFLQIKNEDWGGAFVELLEEQNVPDKAVIEAVIVPKSIEQLQIPERSVPKERLPKESNERGDNSNLVEIVDASPHDGGGKQLRLSVNEANGNIGLRLPTANEEKSHFTS